MRDMYLWLRVDDNVTEKDIIKKLSEKGVTYGIHPLPDFDWLAFRREAAKDILGAVIAKKSSMCSYVEVVEEAIKFADVLIKQLRDGQVHQTTEE